MSIAVLSPSRGSRTAGRPAPRDPKRPTGYDAARDLEIDRRVCALRARGVPWAHVAAQLGISEVTLRDRYASTPRLRERATQKPEPLSVMPPADKRGLQADSFVVSVLSLLAEYPRSAVELARALDAPKMRVHNALTYAQRHGYIFPADRDGKRDLNRRMTPEGCAALIAVLARRSPPPPPPKPPRVYVAELARERVREALARLWADGVAASPPVLMRALPQMPEHQVYGSISALEREGFLARVWRTGRRGYDVVRVVA